MYERLTIPEFSNSAKMCGEINNNITYRYKLRQVNFSFYKTHANFLATVIQSVLIGP